MNRYNQRAIRKRILQNRGLVEAESRSGPRLLKLGQEETEVEARLKKGSLLARQVEATYGMPIREVLRSHRLSDIAKATGVDRVTLWRWQKLLAN